MSALAVLVPIVSLMLAIDVLGWSTAAAALIAAVASVISVLLPMWWRQPDLHIGPGGGWNPHGDELLGLPLHITNDGGSIVRGLRCVGLCDGKVVTRPSVIDVLAGRTELVFVNFPRPPYADFSANQDALFMPSGRAGRAP